MCVHSSLLKILLINVDIRQLTVLLHARYFNWHCVIIMHYTKLSGSYQHFIECKMRTHEIESKRFINIFNCSILAFQVDKGQRFCEWA